LIKIFKLRMCRCNW